MSFTSGSVVPAALKKKQLPDVNHGLKSQNRDYLAEVCGRKVGERAAEQRHDTDMAVTRSHSQRVSRQTDTQEMNCLTTLVRHYFKPGELQREEENRAEL